MSNSVLIHWSKRAAIIAGILWPLVFVIVLLITQITGNTEGSSPPPESFDVMSLGIAAAFYIPFIVMMVSLVGVHARYKERWRVLGKLGLTFALISLAVIPLAGAAGLVGTPQGFDPSSIGRVGIFVAVLGNVVLGAGFIMLGLAAFRSGVPSRRFGAILIGIGLFQASILLVSVLRVLAYSLGWIVLGWALPPAHQIPDSDSTAA